MEELKVYNRRELALSRQRGSKRDDDSQIKVSLTINLQWKNFDL